VVVTNNLLAEQEGKISALKLEHLIDHLIVSEKVGIPKPAPEMFRAALMAAECEAEETVMVGDSWEMDVMGAQAVGIRAVWLNRSGKVCPVPALATEITSLEPLDHVLNILLGTP
jgi:FMN phosphatase YigB (HAD superfamily)